MNRSNTQITEPYSPNDSLEPSLESVRKDASLTYTNETEFAIAPGISAKQLSYDISFDGVSLDGTETICPGVVMVSLKGHLRCAATIQLANALTYGRPTLLYTDVYEQTTQGDPYVDLTAEWYATSAEDDQVWSSRMENRIANLQEQRVDVQTVERWSEGWLQADD